MFKKRSADPDELERLRSEIAAMGARLDATDSAKAELGNRVDDIATRLDEPTRSPVQPTEPMVTQSDHDMLRARVQRLTDQIEAASESGAPSAVDPEHLDALRARVEALTERLDTPIGPPPTDPPPPPPPPASATDPAEVDALREQMQRITERIDEVDARVTSISNELANQLSELSDELDARPAERPAGDDVVDDLRDAQTRLANEQARYQIAFRQDLAELAERLKRA
jgi:DNA repair exonuclease SbcCD ATPase subunit